MTTLPCAERSRVGRRLPDPAALTTQLHPSAPGGGPTHHAKRPAHNRKTAPRNVLLRPAVRRWHQLWVPHLRRQWVEQMLPEPGATITNDEASNLDASADAPTNIRRALQRYWAPIFRAATSDDDEADRLISSHMGPLGGDPIMPPDNATVRAALKKVRDTATGPDGLPYSAWRAGGNETATVLRRTRAAASATARYPSHFCDAVAVFLPKGAAHHDDALTGMRRRQACNTRPLAWTDTGAKSIMTLLNRPVARRLPHWAPPQQQGFIRWRGALQNVLKLDTSARCLTMLALDLDWDDADDDENDDGGPDDDATPQRRRRPRDETPSEDMPPTCPRLDDGVTTTGPPTTASATQRRP